MNRRIHLVLVLTAAALVGWTGARAAEPQKTKPEAPSAPPGTPSAKHSTIHGLTVVDSSYLTRPEGHPRVFLAWDAPWGLPRARDAATAACEDTTGVDTLYVTFDPGEYLFSLMGVDLALTFRPAPGDTLGPFWDFTRSGANPWNLRIEFDEPPPGCPSPWPVSGMGSPRYKLSPDSGRLDLAYFVPSNETGPVDSGNRYFLARVMIRQRKPKLGGCRQPVCVELNQVLVSYAGGSRWITDGERFVSWNSPGGAACAKHRLRPPDVEPPRFGGRLDLQEGARSTPKAARGDTLRK